MRGRNSKAGETRIAEEQVRLRASASASASASDTGINSLHSQSAVVGLSGKPDAIGLLELRANVSYFT